MNQNGAKSTIIKKVVHKQCFINFIKDKSFVIKNSNTGCTTAVLYTLPASYDKTKRCTKKVMLNIFSV